MQSTTAHTLPNNSKRGLLSQQWVCTGKLHFLCLISSILTVLWVSFPSRKELVSTGCYQPLTMGRKTRGRKTAAQECAPRCVLITKLPPTGRARKWTLPAAPLPVCAVQGRAAPATGEVGKNSGMKDFHSAELATCMCSS